jgi:hypothetical protein
MKGSGRKGRRAFPFFWPWRKTVTLAWRRKKTGVVGERVSRLYIGKR